MSLKMYFLTLGLFFSLSSYAETSKLGLEDYLKQVRSQNEAYLGSVASVRGGLLRSSDAALLYSPTLFASHSIYKDQLPQNVLFSNYKEYQQTQTQLGLKTQTPIGLNAQLTYNLTRSQYLGLTPEFYDARPTLELSQSIFKNFFGSETRANHQVIESQAKASSLAADFNSKNILTDAETTYWRLVFARKTLEVQKASFERAKGVFDWAAKRTRVQLADQSDLYQADANLKLHKLYLQQAEDELRNASLQFNAARGVGGDQVLEQTEDADRAFLNMKAPEKKGTRLDVQAALEQTKASQASSKVGGEKFKPDVSLFGSYSWGARKSSQADAMSNAWTTENRALGYGIRLTAPLDFFSGLDSSKGWSSEVEAADLNYRRKLFDQDRDWSDLNSRFRELSTRLELSQAIEKVQLEKANLERNRLKQGRSTTFLVSTYEQDYSTAQLTTIQIKAEMMSIVAKMKLFEGESQ